MHKLTTDELVHELEVKKHADFDAEIKQQYSDYLAIPVTFKPTSQDTKNTYDLPFDEVDPMVPELDIVE